MLSLANDSTNVVDWHCSAIFDAVAFFKSFDSVNDFNAIRYFFGSFLFLGDLDVVHE